MLPGHFSIICRQFSTIRLKPVIGNLPILRPVGIIARRFSASTWSTSSSSVKYNVIGSGLGFFSARPAGLTGFAGASASAFWRVHSPRVPSAGALLSRLGSTCAGCFMRSCAFGSPITSFLSFLTISEKVLSGFCASSIPDFSHIIQAPIATTITTIPANLSQKVFITAKPLSPGEPGLIIHSRLLTINL